jgi:hypothetical protein
MKRLFRPLILGFAVLLPATPVLAATTVFHSTFKGQAASAFFVSVDPSGCIDTAVSVNAQDEATKVDGQPGVTSVAFLFISVFDNCTQTSLVSAAGSAALAPDDLIVQKLDSATLDTSIEVDDFASGTTFTVDVSLNWTGVGDQFRGKTHSHFTSPGFRVNSRFDATSRGATASGTVSDGTTNYTPAPDLAANLVMAKSGDVVVQKL